MKHFTEYLNEAFRTNVVFRIAKYLGDNGMKIIGNNTETVNRKDIIGSYTTSVGTDLVLRQTDFSKKFGRKCFPIYIQRDKVMSLVKFGRNGEVYLIDHNDDDGSSILDGAIPVFTSYLHAKEFVAVDTSFNETPGGDPMPVVDFAEFAKTEFGRAIFQ